MIKVMFIKYRLTISYQTAKDNSALIIFNVPTHMLNIYIWDSGVRFPESTFEC